MREPVHLGCVAYQLGELCPISAMASDGDDDETIGLLRGQGLETFSRITGSVGPLILDCVTDSLAHADVHPAHIDDIVVVTESYAQILRDHEPQRGETAFWCTRNRLVFGFAELGLVNARVHSSTYGGSNNLLHAVRGAVSLLETGRSTAVLLLCIDQHPPGTSRFMSDALAITGDAVASCLLTSGPSCSSGFQIEHVGLAPYSGSLIGAATGPRVLDMYRKVKGAAADCYEDTGRKPEEFDRLILNTYNEMTIRVFAHLLGFSTGKVYIANLIRTGHLPCSDGLVNLLDSCNDAMATDGEPMLVFATGPSTCGAMSLLHRTGEH